MTIEQLQQQEKALLAQLKQVRKQIASLQTSTEPTKTIKVDHEKEELEKLSKAEIIKILNDMSTLKLTEAEKRKTKKYLIECIIRRQRAQARGRAFSQVK